MTVTGIRSHKDAIEGLFKIVVTNDFDTRNYLTGIYKPRYGKFKYVLTFDDASIKDKIKKQIEDINSLLSELDFLADAESYESDAMEMYRARKNVIKPPQIVPQKDFWSAECIFCFSYGTGGKSEKDAIGRIRHSKHCMYPKDVKKFHGKHKDMEVWRYIRSIPPRDK